LPKGTLLAIISAMDDSFDSSPRVWVLHDSRFAVASAKRSFELPGFPAPDWPESDLQIEHLTRAEVELKMALVALNFESEVPVAMLDEQEAELLMFKLVGLKQTELPTLWQELSASRFKGQALPLSLPTLRSCIDNARIFERQDRIFLDALESDEFEEAGSLRAGELLELIEHYQSLMEGSGSWDRAGALSVLSSKLGVERFSELLKAETLPSAIVLNNPATIFPLEQSIWTRVSQLTKLMLLRTESEDCSSIEVEETGEESLLLDPGSGVRDLGKFPSVEEVLLEPVNPLVSGTTPSLPDSSLKDASLRLGRARSRKDEVRSILADIKTRIASGEDTAQDFQIILLKKEVYLPLFEKEAERQGLPINNSSGASIRTTRAGSSFLSWLEWLEKGSLRALAELYSKPLLKERFLNPEEMEPLQKLHASELQQIETAFGLPASIEELALAETFRFEELFESLRQLNSSWVFRSDLDSTEAKGFVAALLERLAGVSPRDLGQDESFIPKLIAQLAALLSEVNRRQGLKKHTSWTALSRDVRSHFYEMRDRKSDKSGSENELAGELTQAQAFRSILLSERRLRKLEYVVSEFDDHLLSQLTDSWRRLLRELRFPAETDPDAVSVTGFLDIRGIRNKHSYLPGFENSLFPGSRENLFSANQLELARKAVDRPWPASADWYRLFDLLKHSCKSLFVTVPETGEGKEISPAVKFLQLSEQVTVETLQSEKPSAEVEGDRRTIELLQARKSSQFTSYDGLLEPSESLDKLFSKRGMLGENSNHHYSPTLLELYAACPQTFLFSEVLGLRLFESPFQFRAALETGNLLHVCLEQVYGRYCSGRDFSSPDETPSKENLLPALEVLTQEAEQEFSNLLARSGLEKFSNKDLERFNQLEKLREGLATGEDDGRRGLVKAALAYSSELFQSACLAVEQDFGKGENPPVMLEGVSGQQILVRGKIDRIDQLASGEFLVIDYKTGKEKTFSEVMNGKSLQTALYATWLLQNVAGLRPDKLRGGMLQLGKPNRRGEDIRAVTKGVFNEQLAIKKQGRGYAIDFSGVEENIERAAAFVAEYDQRIFSGDFRYGSDQDDVLYRGFSRIAYRNPTKLVEEQLVLEDSEVFKDRPNWSWQPVLEKTPEAGSAGAPATLTEEQSEASDPKNSIVLRASAGSGKTRVLQSRYLRLLLEGVTVEQIVAITFTEKAAREIQSRVESRVQQVLASGEFEGQTLDDQQKSRLASAMDELNKSRIGTIHSFARSIIGSDPVLSGGAAEFDLPGGEQLRELAESCLYRLLESEENAEEAKLVLRSGMSWPNFKSTVLGLILGRSRLAQCEEILKLEVSKASSLPVEYKSSLEQVFLEHSEELVPELDKTLKQLLAGAKECLAEKAKKKIEDEKVNDWELLFASIEGFLSKLKIVKPGSSATEYHQVRTVLEEKKSSAFRKSKAHPNYWKELEAVFTAPENTIFGFSLAQEAENFKLAGAIIGLATRGLKIYEAEKKARKVIDFDDLIHLASSMIKPVEGDSDKTVERKDRLKLKLKERIKAIMVDEFQDTDAVQWELISNLVDDESSLFVVGDSQQAIYGFRGGDSSVFESALELVKSKSGKELGLTRNFRSNASIIKFVSEVFPALFDVDYFRTGEPRIKGATRSWPMVSPAEGVEQRVFLGFDEYPRSRSNEAMAVAQRVREILNSVQEKDGSWPALEERSGNLVALLARKGEDLLALGRALDLLNVPYQISRSGVFYDLEEVVQFENLLKVLIDPKDKIALAGVLRAPLYGLSDAQLVEFFSGSFEGADVITEELEQFRRLSRSLSASQLVEEVIEKRKLRQSYSAAEFEGGISNIEGLIAVIRAEELSGNCDGSLKSAFEVLQQKIADGEKPPEIDLDSRPVVLSTIHGSKGLEFPMVILPMLEQERSGLKDFIVEESSMVSSRLPLVGVRVEDPDKEYRRSKTLSGFLAEQQARQLAASEAKRLFYVACTRAEEYLLLAMRKEKTEKERPSDLNKAIRASQSPAGWLRMIAKKGDTSWTFISPNNSQVEIRLR